MAINPLQAPINYAVDVQSPFQAALGGLQLGAGLAEIDAAQQKRQLEANALQQAQQRQTDLANLYKNPNATSADYARVAAFLPEKQAAIVTQGFERLTKEQQQSDLRMGGEVYSAIKSGNLDVAKRMLTDKAAALRNSGRESEAKAAEDSLELINLNPTGAQATIGIYMARLPGGKDFLDNVDKALSTLRAEDKAPFELTEAQAKATKAAQEALNAVLTAEDDIAKVAAQRRYEEAKALKERADADVAEATKGTRIGKAASEAEEAAVKARFAEQLAQGNVRLNDAQIRNITSQINDRAEKLNLDRQTMQATVAEKLSSIQKNVNELPADTRKLVNESAVAAAASKQAAGQYNDLAKRLEAAGGGYGAASSFSDFATKTFGINAPLTQLRQEYTRIRNSAAIKSLPPGVATDKDIELALKGIPPENADARTMASFLRGLAKMQDIDSSIANAKTDWLASNNGTLTRAKNTFIAGDYAAKPGETFNDFAQRIVGDVSQKYRSPAQIAEEQRQQSIGRIPTNAAPAAAPTAPAANAANDMTRADAIIRGGR
jgi:hypothetical protein